MHWQSGVDCVSTNSMSPRRDSELGPARNPQTIVLTVYVYTLQKNSKSGALEVERREDVSRQVLVHCHWEFPDFNSLTLGDPSA
jgi:hypothetical protein